MARPERTAKAVLAMLKLLEGRRLDKEVSERLLPFVDPADSTSIADSLHQRLEEPRGKAAGKEPPRPSVMLPRKGNCGTHSPCCAIFARVSIALRQRRSANCCRSAAGVSTGSSKRPASSPSSWSMGVPGRIKKPAIVNPQRDVDAAVLRDVERMKYREIEQSLEVEISENARRVDDYSTVSKMVNRGRDILERAFGQRLPASGRCVRAPRTRRRGPRGLRAGGRPGRKVRSRRHGRCPATGVERAGARSIGVPPRG